MLSVLGSESRNTGSTLVVAHFCIVNDQRLSLKSCIYVDIIREKGRRKGEILHWPLNSRDTIPFCLSIFFIFCSCKGIFFCVCLCQYKNCQELWLRQHDIQPHMNLLHNVHLVWGVNDRSGCRSVCDNSLYWEVSEHHAWIATHSAVIESHEFFALLLRRGNFIVYEVLLRRDYC